MATIYHCKDDELMHYGRKGMKWGQHIFSKAKSYGSAKRKEMQLNKARKEKAKTREAALKRAEKIKSGKMSPKKMTDKELEDFITEKNKRKDLERQYKKLNSPTQKLPEINSKQISKGKEAIKYIGKNVILPEATTIGRELLRKEMRKALKLNNTDPTESLRKEVAKKSLVKQNMELDEYFEGRKKKD